MFSRLPESNAKRQRRLGGFATSAVVHGVLIALAIRATTLTATPAPRVHEVPPIYIPAREPVRETPRSAAVQPTNTTVTPTAPPDLPVPVIDLSQIPETIADVSSRSVIWGEEFTSPRSGRIDTTPGTSMPNGNGAPLEERFVEKAIVAIPGTATPRYPSMLQSSGLEGDVRAQFVVDTLGRVEKGSVRVLDTTHELFATAVREALSRARFTAAEAGGRKVRQLAEQVFTFRITK